MKNNELLPISPEVIPLPELENPPFKALRLFNTSEGQRLAHQRHRITPELVHWFKGDPLIQRIVAELAKDATLDVKEVCESIEFFARTHKKIASPILADLCCGHGLTGLLFAALEKKVERVYLLDKRRPEAHEKVLRAVAQVAPWVLEKIIYLEMTLRQAQSTIPTTATLMGLHACGGRTDEIIHLGLELGCPMAVMPCCYGQTAPDAPNALRSSLGRRLSTDIHRTYRLWLAGYDVAWSAIPRAISPMNRIMIALPGHPQTTHSLLEYSIALEKQATL